MFSYCVFNIVKHIFLKHTMLCALCLPKKKPKITSDLFHLNGENSDNRIHVFYIECKLVPTLVFLCVCHRITVYAYIHIIIMKTKYKDRSD